MINPIDPGWVRINDALHKQDRRQRRRQRRESAEEDEGMPEIDERHVADEESKLDVVA